MTDINRWKQLRRLRNRCFLSSFFVGIVGLVGVILFIPEPSWDKLEFGVKVGLVFYVIVVSALLLIGFRYHMQMLRLVKSVEVR